MEFNAEILAWIITIAMVSMGTIMVLVHIMDIVENIRHKIECYELVINTWAGVLGSCVYMCFMWTQTPTYSAILWAGVLTVCLGLFTKVFMYLHTPDPSTSVY